MASMVVPPSLPFNNKCLLLVSDLISKSEVSRLNLPNEVPPSFKMISISSNLSVVISLKHQE